MSVAGAVDLGYGRRDQPLAVHHAPSPEVNRLALGDRPQPYRLRAAARPLALPFLRDRRHRLRRRHDLDHGDGIVDNAIILAIPGAMDAGLADPLFWGSLAFALAVAFVVPFPVDRLLISRGKGHAVVHAHHGH